MALLMLHISFAAPSKDPARRLPNADRLLISAISQLFDSPLVLLEFGWMIALLYFHRLEYSDRPYYAINNLFAIGDICGFCHRAMFFSVFRRPRKLNSSKYLHVLHVKYQSDF